MYETQPIYESEQQQQPVYTPQHEIYGQSPFIDNLEEVISINTYAKHDAGTTHWKQQKKRDDAMSKKKPNPLERAIAITLIPFVAGKKKK